MGTFNRILFIADENSRRRTPFDHVVELASAQNAEITVVAVAKPVSAAARKVIREALPNEDIDKLVTGRQEQKLSKLVETAASKGVKIHSRILEGRLFIEVIREVLRGKHDLVVKVQEAGSHGSFFGSSDLHLLRKCPCPVWIMSATPDRRYRRIMAAIDPGPEQRAHSEEILKIAVQTAESEQSDLHVLHAWELEGEEFLREGFGFTPTEEVDALVLRQEAKHQGYLDSILDSRPTTAAVHRHLVKGDPSHAITAFAEKMKVDLIVMGTVGRTGIPGFFIGNTAETVLNHVNCSVLAVKPAGFVSPVSPK